MKAPATRTAKKGKPAATGVKASSSATASRVSSTSKSAAKVAPKPSAKAVAKPAAKAGKTSSASKSVAPVKSGPSSKPSRTAAKTAAVSATRPVKPVSKTMAKTAVKPVAKPATPAPAKPVAKSAVAKPAVKASVKPAPAPVSKVPSKTAPATASASASKTSSTRSPAAPAKAATPMPVVEPTPRPLGKRAAKKVMMEQMTQAAVIPTHAPDAAKATFSTMNERAVMTPPVPSSIQKDPKRANNWKTVPVEQLTDQDIQAMPDSEYMSELQLSYFRRKLSQLKADMLANAGETTEHLREDTVVVPDPADRATIEEEHALELRTRDRERKLLKKIEQAIARIDSGDYGYCEETGEAIGVGRLMARPTASLSLEAQQRRELKQKMFGD